MAEKELRRLKRRDLLQMLLMQCEETERLQQETDEMKEKMDVILESYERLKKKLDVKDERLNQKDAKIAELGCQMEEMLAEKAAGEEKLTAIEEAFFQFREMFEDIWNMVERYTANEQECNAGQEPLETGKIISIHKKRNAVTGQTVSGNFGGSEGDLEQCIASEKASENEYELAVAVSGEIYG